MRCSVVILLLAVTAADRSSYDLTLDDAEVYLTANGFPAGLPLLDVSYKSGAWGKKYNIQGGEHLSTHGSLNLGERPLISWAGGSDGQQIVNRHSVMMINPDYPRAAGGNGSEAGAEGPVLLWFAINCETSTAKSDDKCMHFNKFHWMPPQDGSGEHRFIFVLFQQIRPPPPNLIKDYLIVQHRTKFNLRGFMEALDGSMEPRAINFFYLSTAKQAEAIEAPYEAGKIPPPPPAPLDAALKEPQSRSLGPKSEAKPPTGHDEL